MEATNSLLFFIFNEVALLIDNIGKDTARYTFDTFVLIHNSFVFL